MKLIHKILLGYILIISIIGIFSTSLLIYNINEQSKNIDAYREREITSFAKVIDAFIPNQKSLEDTRDIQKLFLSTIHKLPHIKRLTLHAQDKESLQYIHIASSIINIIGTPSHREDINAILKNTSTLLYENSPNGDRFLDLTYPILDASKTPIAALGIAVSLKESDFILEKALLKMKEDAINIVILAVLISTSLALIIAFIISKKIVLPIEQLKKAIVLTSENHTKQEIEISSGDEIGELAIEFNKMSAELHSLYSSMEDKITEKTKELETQFFTDSLTGLSNRYALFNITQDLTKFHVAILDISAFKDINDTYGIEIGNKVLKELSKKYAYYILDTKLALFRLSSDEMVILNPDTMNEDEFTATIGQIIHKIEHETFYFNDDSIEINISIHSGISFLSKHALEKANIALICAKERHLDYMVFNLQDYNKKSQSNSIQIISKIKHALENFGIIVHYQGITDSNGKIIKYEALVRMRDADKIISPFVFLDISKKTKYYQEITKTVIFMALEEFKDRAESISINLCAEDLSNTKTKDFIKEKLSLCKNPQQVIFELVESEDIHSIPELNEFISYIKSTGAKIAIDDFGTGYSNFAYLMDLEPDYIKIDGSLIKNIDHDERSKRIVNTIVKFAKGLDIKVIAEFVHSKEVLDICLDLGVDEFQGYYFSEPSTLS